MFTEGPTGENRSKRQSRGQKLAEAETSAAEEAKPGENEKRVQDPEQTGLKEKGRTAITEAARDRKRKTVARENRVTNGGPRSSSRARNVD